MREPGAAIRAGRLAAVLIAVVTGGCATVPSAEVAAPDDLERRMRTYLTARYGGDAGTAEALLAPDARVWHGVRVGPGARPDLRGPAAAWDREMNTQLDEEWVEADGRTVRGRFVEVSDFYRLVGIYAWQVEITFWFDERGRIAGQLYAPLPPPENPDLLAHFQPALTWLAAHHAAELEAIYPAQRLVRTGETARRWRELLDRWLAERGSANAEAP